MKKILFTYSALFIFAFTFAFAFNMAGSVQASDPPCCEIHDCPGYPEYISKWGHFVKVLGCVFNGEDDCDFAYLCPD